MSLFPSRWEIHPGFISTPVGLPLQVGGPAPAWCSGGEAARWLHHCLPDPGALQHIPQQHICQLEAPCQCNYHGYYCRDGLR